MHPLALLTQQQSGQRCMQTQEQPVTWWLEVCAWLLGAAERVLMILAMLPTTPLLPSFCSIKSVFMRASD